MRDAERAQAVGKRVGGDQPQAAGGAAELRVGRERAGAERDGDQPLAEPHAEAGLVHAGLELQVLRSHGGKRDKERVRLGPEHARHLHGAAAQAHVPLRKEPPEAY